MGKESRPRKIKHDKFHTRARSEKLLAQGADPTATFIDDKGAVRNRYLDHPNYHVRNKAWKRMGMPLPEDQAERSKFLASIHVKEVVAEPAPEAESTQEQAL